MNKQFAVIRIFFYFCKNKMDEKKLMDDIQKFLARCIRLAIESKEENLLDIIYLLNLYIQKTFEIANYIVNNYSEKEFFDILENSFADLISHFEKKPDCERIKEYLLILRATVKAIPGIFNMSQEEIIKMSSLSITPGFFMLCIMEDSKIIPPQLYTKFVNLFCKSVNEYHDFTVSIIRKNISSKQEIVKIRNLDDLESCELPPEPDWTLEE